MKLKTKHIIELIGILLTVLGGIIIALISSNKQKPDTNEKNKNNISINVPVNISNENKQIPSRDTAHTGIQKEQNAENRIERLKKLKLEGEKLLEDYEDSKKEIITWKSECKGILGETNPEIDRIYQEIENSHATNDYHSQAKDIIQLLNSEISNQQTKSK